MRETSLDEMVERYGLEPHPEGGYYTETWRSNVALDGEALPEHPGPRSAGTAILYLLPEGTLSEWHRMRSEEIWMFHAGNPVELSRRESPEASVESERLGNGETDRLHASVPRRWWQRAESLEGPAGWSLVACVVIPGFEFEDFELAES